MSANNATEPNVSATQLDLPVAAKHLRKQNERWQNGLDVMWRIPHC
jgi:hypothetical protein